MSRLHFTTPHANVSDVKRAWFLVDASGKTVGRLASQLVGILRGKHKAYFTPHVDCGDFVVVINAEKVVFTGNKFEDKLYTRFTGYPGGKKDEQAKSLLARRPEQVLERAVRGMLPKTRLGRKVFKKLFVYAGSDHPHGGQSPEVLAFNQSNLVVQ